MEICIATMNRDDLAFLQPMFNMKAADIPYNILIVNQSKSNTLQSNFSNIRVINDEHFGLSRSRNIAIKNSVKSILWFLDDDCVIVNGAIDHIIAAHNSYTASVITFKTITSGSGKPFWEYPKMEVLLSKKQIRKVLSPEITIKKEPVLQKQIKFNTNFGLGAQFQDSENYLFLIDVMTKGCDIQFKNNSIVKHENNTSSDEVTSDRMVYARGALAAREYPRCTLFFKWKYVFFLWRKGYVKQWNELSYKYSVYSKGVNDYLSTCENQTNT